MEKSSSIPSTKQAKEEGEDIDAKNVERPSHPPMERLGRGPPESALSGIAFSSVGNCNELGENLDRVSEEKG